MRSHVCSPPGRAGAGRAGEVRAVSVPVGGGERVNEEFHCSADLRGQVLGQVLLGVLRLGEQPVQGFLLGDADAAVAGQQGGERGAEQFIVEEQVGAPHGVPGCRLAGCPDECPPASVGDQPEGDVGGAHRVNGSVDRGGGPAVTDASCQRGAVRVDEAEDLRFRVRVRFAFGDGQQGERGGGGDVVGGVGVRPPVKVGEEGMVTPAEYVADDRVDPVSVRAGGVRRVGGDPRGVGLCEGSRTGRAWWGRARP